MLEPTFVCLYCGNDKTASESSLEHAIPQFMGGNVAPLHYMLRNVCKQCNNRLGLFVDASYAKSWFVTNGLSIAAQKLYTGLADPALPLVCMGLSMISGLVLDEEQVAEHWIGPSGETVIWLRQNDERLHGYSGGNPIDKKKKPSTAYLCLTGQDPIRWKMGIASFLEMFRHHRIRKILCANAVGPSGNEIFPGFDIRTVDDETNVGVIMTAINAGDVQSKIGINASFDLRFVAKMVLGVGYSLFGEPHLDTDISKEARKILWPKDDDVGQARGRTTLGAMQNQTFASLIGYPGAVVISVMKVSACYVLTVTVNQAIPFVVELAPSALLSPFINRDEGYALVLFPSLREAIEITQAELLAHSSGAQKNLQLDAIDTRFAKAIEFWSHLGPV